LYHLESMAGNTSSKARARRPGSGARTPEPGVTRGVLQLVSRGPEETQAIGREIGKLAESGDLYLLTGNLGAGKTCLTQGIAWGLGVEGFISSPSFVILREYRGRLHLYHVDLYRMQSIAEIRDLGLDDYLYGKGVCVVEWANRGWEYPGDYMCIEMQIVSETERRLSFSFQGERYAGILDRLGDTFGKAGERQQAPKIAD